MRARFGSLAQHLSEPGAVDRVCDGQALTARRFPDRLKRSPQASVEEHDSPVLTRTPFCWFSPLVMIHPIRYAMLLSIAVAFPAAAQTTATPGAVTQSGVVNFGTGATSGSTAPSAVSTKGAAATGSATGSSAAGVGSRAGGLANAGSSTSSRSSAGSISGSASTSPVSSVPHWVLCAPSGASGQQPFFTGTNLSCAP